MSFIVKGAEIPKTCLDCPLSDVEQGWCDSDMVTIIDFNKLPVECPLVALPDKHGRLIDADAYLESVKPRGISDELWKESNTYKSVASMPTIKPQPHWIPCEERLPEKNGFYLCTTKDCVTILEFIEGNPHYHEEPSFVSDVLGKCNSYVVAWMPLPEPYQGN